MILLEAIQSLQTLRPDSQKIQISDAPEQAFSSACSSDALSPGIAPAHPREDQGQKKTSVPQETPATPIKTRKQALIPSIDPPSETHSIGKKSYKQSDGEREVLHSHINGAKTIEPIPFTSQEETWLEKQDNHLKMNPIKDSPEEWLDLPFETWVSRISQAREELLAAHLQEDAICVALEPWRITLHVTPWVPKDFGSRLQSCLNHLTQRTWTVTCIQHTEPLENTLAQKERVSLEEQKERLMKHPTVQAWQKLFPSMTFHTLRISSFTETKGANHLI
jgi:DNA polymerase III gamma and tau subunits C terminal